MSPDHRDIIDLVYYQEKAIAEVAEIIGIPENTVKTRMFYARKRLAELLKSAGLTTVPMRAPPQVCWCSGSQPKTS